MSQQDRTEIFHRHLKGISAHRTAQIFSVLNPAIDFRGCPKRHMLAVWVSDDSLAEKYGGFTHFTEQDLIDAKVRASLRW